MTSDYLFGEPRETVRNIVRDVARSTGLSVADIHGPAQRGPAVKARHAAMYLARVRTGKSYQALGRIFGRDHKTVMSAVRKVEASPNEYPIGE